MPRRFGFRGFPPAIALAILLLAPVSQAAQQVDVAAPAQGLAELPLVVAERNRYFATEGFEIRKIQIQADIAVRALLAGAVELNLSWEASARAAIAGAPITLVGAIAARPLQVLIARPEIRSNKDLRGKTVAVDGSPGMGEYLARLALRSLGIDPDRELNIVEIGGAEWRMEELRDGSVHAAIVDAGTAARAAEQGFKRLVRLADISELPVLGVAVATKNLAAERERIKSFLRAVQRATRFIKKDRAGTLRIVQSYLKLTPSQAARAYEDMAGVFTEDGLISDRALALSVRRAREDLPIALEPNLNRIADWSLLREIAAERRKIPFWLKQYDP